MCSSLSLFWRKMWGGCCYCCFSWLSWPRTGRQVTRYGDSFIIIEPFILPHWRHMSSFKDILIIVFNLYWNCKHISKRVPVYMCFLEKSLKTWISLYKKGSPVQVGILVSLPCILVWLDKLIRFLKISSSVFRSSILPGMTFLCSDLISWFLFILINPSKFIGRRQVDD